MLSKAEVRLEKPKEVRSSLDLTPTFFWQIRGKTPVPKFEITREYPRAYPFLERYDSALAEFLRQEDMAGLCENVYELQLKQEKTKNKPVPDDLRRKKGEIDAALANVRHKEQETDALIKAEREDAHIIFDRTRTIIYQQKGLPNRSFLGKVLSLIPGLPIETHLLLKPIALEKEKLKKIESEVQKEIEAWISARVAELDSQRKAEGLMQENIGTAFVDWVCLSPERLIPHLLQFPDEVDFYRREFTRRQLNRPDLRSSFENDLRKFGLLTKRTRKPKYHPPAEVTQTGVEDTDDEAGWGFIFTSGEHPELVVKRDKGIRYALESAAGRKFPEETKEKIHHVLLRLQRDPLRAGMDIKTIEVETLKQELGKYKIRLRGGHRIFYDLETKDGQKVIIIRAIMTHDEWNKMQHK